MVDNMQYDFHEKKCPKQEDFDTSLATDLMHKGNQDPRKSCYT